MQKTHQMVTKHQIETKKKSKARSDQKLTPFMLNVGD